MLSPQNAPYSKCYLLKMLFPQNAISSKCYFLKMLSPQNANYTKCYLLKMLLHYLLSNVQYGPICLFIQLHDFFIPEQSNPKNRLSLMLMAVKKSWASILLNPWCMKSFICDGIIFVKKLEYLNNQMKSKCFQEKKGWTTSPVKTRFSTITFFSQNRSIPHMNRKISYAIQNCTFSILLKDVLLFGYLLRSNKKAKNLIVILCK